MRYLSLFSGIEAASVAWKPLGWDCVAVAEVDAAACAVLAHHYPSVPNLGDVTAITEAQIKELGHIDLVVFGSPCQDLSVAGKRAGLEGSRSGLFFDAIRIIRWSRARWSLFENVPGLFSSNGGADFAVVVRELAGVLLDVPRGGWKNTGVAIGERGLAEWTVLDAQWFGVPQRRRRVFVVTDSGDWRSRPPVLFERQSLSGYPPPRRETRERVAYDTAPCVGASGRGFRTTGETRGQDCVIPVASTGEISHCLNAGGMGRIDYETETLITAFRASGQDGFAPSEVTPPVTSTDGGGAGVPTVVQAFYSTESRCNNIPAAGVAPPLVVGRGGGQPPAISYAVAIRGRNGVPQVELGDEVANAILPPNGGRGGIGVGATLTRSAVRRLTPLECTRLQGFPDNYFAGIRLSDSAIYKMLGNSMAVPCISWLGKRIQEVDAHDFKGTNK